MSSGLPEPVERTTERLFHALSKARRGRILHPRGAAYRISVEVGRGIEGSAALPGGERVAGVARFSRGLGLPRGPDFLGIALRLETDQDVLLAASWSPPPLRFVPRPARSFFGPEFTTLLPLEANGRLLLLAVRADGVRAPGLGALDELTRAAAREPVRLDLAAASPGGRWTPVGLAETAERLTDEEARTLAFDAWRCGGGLRPWSWPNRLRQPAYRGSRRGRAAAT